MGAVAELVRAPAALTVLGDTVAGAAASGSPLRGRRWTLPLASVALYWAGMALNDWADRDLDAVERPERPIPSGRLSAGAALATGGVLTAAGLGIAWFGGGQRSLRVALPLAGAIWAYDTKLKGTAAGPCGMAACRALDVLLGAGGRWRDAAPAAIALGVHTHGVTALSAGEVHGGSARTARTALAGTAVATALAVAGRRGSRRDRLAALGFAGGYAATVGRAQYGAAERPSAPRVRAATMAGIHGMVPLQAGLTARYGAARVAAALATALPLARRLARKVSPT
ncbi:4-hydroxybenzoate polyprenyltransferase [Prauserella sp. PE36]|uniref:4-hydroxybenzoate polyprenyltransferase n=1 Tax=Prauserella endophytica TaxID=1592324 RepID=A0ABY2S6V5_9PSEU|nr:MULTISPECIES: UbiA family prenyltransferase [Prauserella]PXY21860.1 4-hydroxybenzoate polyprenyltransferase [Prauserella coralliicola]RBM13892.1 4-hydroxybenzoate polyprenyltransferase [Prauserella sp. PE36]TKG71664.1 4-hydroxybenzoate polyprenyltransferase [Prauserella endophytica]